MTKEWADEYCEEYAFYYSEKPRKCQNPNCGNPNIHIIWVVRNPNTGELKEIGRFCHQRWKQLRGLPVEPWFEEYEERLRLAALDRIGRYIPESVQMEIKEDTRKKWLLKQVKKNLIHLERVDKPFKDFKNKREADEWAKEHGGYCSGVITIYGKKYWLIYINPQYEGDY